MPKKEVKPSDSKTHSPDSEKPLKKSAPKTSEKPLKGGPIKSNTPPKQKSDAPSEKPDGPQEKEAAHGKPSGTRTDSSAGAGPSKRTHWLSRKVRLPW